MATKKQCRNAGFGTASHLGTSEILCRSSFGIDPTIRRRGSQPAVYGTKIDEWGAERLCEYTLSNDQSRFDDHFYGSNSKFDKG